MLPLIERVGLENADRVTPTRKPPNVKRSADYPDEKVDSVPQNQEKERDAYGHCC